MTSRYTRREYLGVLGAAALGARVSGAALPQQASGRQTFRGNFIILATPYTATKAVDYDDLAAEVEFLHEMGAHGMVWPQNSSDYRLLKADEIMRGMEVLARAHKGKPSALIFGVQQNDTAAMITLAKHAATLEPDGFIAMPPRTAKSQDDYRAYYGELAKLTTKPVIVQTQPNPPGVEFATALVLELAKKYPHLGYVKEEEQPVFDRIAALLPHRPATIKRVFGAVRGRNYPYELRMGTDGTITGAAMYADVFTSIWAAYEQKQWDRVRDMHATVLLMLAVEDEIPGANRYLLQRRGIFKSAVSRRPAEAPTRVQIEEIEHNLAAMKPYMKRPLAPLSTASRA